MNNSIDLLLTVKPQTGILFHPFLLACFNVCVCVCMRALPLSPFVMFVNDPFVNLISFAHAQSFERHLEVVRSRNPGTSQTDVRPTTHVVRQNRESIKQGQI